MNVVNAEELLRQYLSVEDEREAERQLAVILADLATPLIRRIVDSVVRDGDADDVVADTLIDVLRRLRGLRGEVSHPIHDLRRYVARCTYNRCHERLRERHPARSRLWNQVRYLCNHDPNLALWRSPDGAAVCGLREWAGREADGGECLDGVRLAARNDPAAENRPQVAALVLALLRHAGAPLTLDVLSAAVARTIGVSQRRAEVPLSELEVAKEQGADEALDNRMTLRDLWDDVRKLALKQRLALLLNLRDAHGQECLTMLPLTRTATIPEIAAAVGMDAEAFAALWPKLPLSDAAIGELLDVTPRQVIKLRRLARERLRRMAKGRGNQNLGRDLASSSKGATIVTRR
ncbi:MAG TPA: hypothetical protein VE974_04490 [Thermoanaerobaculia bacterium]|nr:hypothetical protein [Thermoanaerobaculia bacterium]